ncbi:M61 family metallopeptidase [Undibacterium terreum]|uniref:Peptidase M61 n=1 Tax=Undibacterium terreum TaxID=1224302 RepID=A0A916XCV3_9BURK|nr:M61 family metallopeptidase [Undibacterium terreum]GGC62461.1 peptidase M61 [Undibacterium terreum]
MRHSLSATRSPALRLSSVCLAVSATLSLAISVSASAYTIPEPVDQVYPGTIVLKVDATNLDQKIFQVRESIPVKPGKLTLLYPKWLPGTHAPTGPLNKMAGLKLSGNGRSLEWQRDTVDINAFHVEIPAGVSVLEAEFQFLSPLEKEQGRITSTNEIVGVQWNTVALYPAGYFARNITVQANLTLPQGWQLGTALDQAEQKGGEVRLKTINFDDLVDSPVFAGKYFRRIDLDPGAKVPVYLNLVADRPENLDAKPEQIDAHKALVKQAYKLFGSQHYKRYDFLLALSDEFSGIGLEHHQSSENGVRPGYFNDWSKSQVGRDLLAHEYTHSWNGKFRRPADLATPNFNVPMQDSLLWVYEGQTQYWGYVLAARSGLMSLPQVRDAIAATAATLDQRNGRSWRSLQDTTNEPSLNGRAYQSWPSWQRSRDFYSEGLLVWLDVDSKLRELSNDKRSLNDFARAFFGIENGSHVPATYTFEQLVQTLNGVQSFDWAAFLRARLDGNGPGAPLDGLKRSGWKLAYAEKPSEYLKGVEDRSKTSDFSYSLGFSVNKENKLENVIWDGIAFKAGIASGANLLAVNGRSYKPELLKSAISEAKGSKEAIELIIKNGDRYRTVRLDYHEGLKYPVLVRLDGTPDRLESILQAMK